MCLNYFFLFLDTPEIRPSDVLVQRRSGESGLEPTAAISHHENFSLSISHGAASNYTFRLQACSWASSGAQGRGPKSNSFLGHHELKVVKAGRGDNCGDYLSCFAMHFVAAGSILLSLL